MHELSIAMNILDAAAAEAHRQGGGKVVGVHVKLGPLSGVVSGALRSAYDIARAGGEMADARLVIEEVPVAAYCPACRENRPILSVQDLRCSECGTVTPHLVSGRELELVALELQ